MQILKFTEVLFIFRILSSVAGEGAGAPGEQPQWADASDLVQKDFMTTEAVHDVTKMESGHWVDHLATTKFMESSTTLEKGPQGTDIENGLTFMPYQVREATATHTSCVVDIIKPGETKVWKRIKVEFPTKPDGTPEEFDDYYGCKAFGSQVSKDTNNFGVMHLWVCDLDRFRIFALDVSWNYLNDEYWEEHADLGGGIKTAKPVLIMENVPGPNEIAIVQWKDNKLFNWDQAKWLDEVHTPRFFKYHLLVIAGGFPYHKSITGELLANAVGSDWVKSTLGIPVDDTSSIKIDNYIADHREAGMLTTPQQKGAVNAFKIPLDFLYSDLNTDPELRWVDASHHRVIHHPYGIAHGQRGIGQFNVIAGITVALDHQLYPMIYVSELRSLSVIPLAAFVETEQKKLWLSEDFKQKEKNITLWGEVPYIPWAEALYRTASHWSKDGTSFPLIRLKLPKMFDWMGTLTGYPYTFIESSVTLSYGHIDNLETMYHNGINWVVSCVYSRSTYDDVGLGVAQEMYYESKGWPQSDGKGFCVLPILFVPVGPYKEAVKSIPVVKLLHIHKYELGVDFDCSITDLTVVQCHDDSCKDSQMKFVLVNYKKNSVVALAFGQS